MRRRLVSCGVVLVCFLVAAVVVVRVVRAAAQSDRDHYSIDLKTIGYHEPPDDYRWLGSIDFLDSERLLVTFPTQTPGPDPTSRGKPEKLRSVVMDFSGKVLRSLEDGEVQPGPSGHILQQQGEEVRILDSDFSILQTVRLEGRPVGRLEVVPERTGFIAASERNAYLPGHVAYFSGMPAKPVLEADSCAAIAVEGGFVCMDWNQPSRSVVHVGPNDPQPDLRSRNTIERPGLDDNPDKKWLKPGRPASLSWSGRAIASSRAMYYQRGILFPITDASGFGHFLRVLVMDIKTKRTIFREQYGAHASVALSPDGKWFAVREGTRLTVNRLP